MKQALLTAFFVRQDEAQTAFRRLSSRGRYRVAIIHKDRSGRVKIRASVRRPLLNRGVLHDIAHRLTVEESVLVLQGPIDALRNPVTLLRENGEAPPIIFVFNPEHEGVVDDLGTLAAPLPPTQIQARAKQLATTSKLNANGAKDTALLDRLKVMREWIGPVCRDLSSSVALGRRATPTIEWLLDNEYVIDSSMIDVQQNVSRRFYRQLPVLENTPHSGLPRVYSLASQLVSDMGLRLDRDAIVGYVEAYQSVTALSTAELWAIPQMLRLALIEGVVALGSRSLIELVDRERADFWANRLITASRRDPDQVFPLLADLTESHSSPSAHFAFQLLDHLYGEESSGALVRNWLERVFQRPIEELNTAERDRQAKEQIAIGNAFGSLRELAQLDWRDIFEELSYLDRVLRLDPAGIYARMDFATRDRYRRAVEKCAHRAGQTEQAVAEAVIELASKGAEATHVGIYLVGESRGELLRQIGANEPRAERARSWVTRHHAAVYISAVGALTALFLALFEYLGLRGVRPGVRISLAVISLLPLSQLAVEIVNYLVMRLFPPRAVAKMEYKDSGIPDAFRTLVVVPMLLVDQQTVEHQLEKTEIRFLANREHNVFYSLFTDYTDSDEQHTDQDHALLQRAVAGIEALNASYGDGRFLLLHRQRVWSESEQAFIGWERKRGKLEELNRLIDGTRPQDAQKLVYVGDPARLREIRFVITLDGDTQLPAGTARRMVETLAHPLNQPRMNADGHVAAGSYTIIQPRVSPSLPSSSGSRFSRLFSHAVGIDPYTRVVSDVNQDLAAEGSYHGKGIYDVRAFSRVLSQRFPEQRLLSHDLIEGAHVRVGLASDIELLDEFPQDYLAFTTRQHRWIRGDWQIAGWILPLVRGADGRLRRNTLSAFNRWKIGDNLRRSLIPLASIALLTAAWFGTPGTVLIASMVVAAQLLFSTLIPSFTMATTRDAFKSFSLSTLGHDLLRTLAEASLLPHQSVLAADAILRVWYRRLVSHRNLLEWGVKASSLRGALSPWARLSVTVWLTSLLSAGAVVALFVWAPDKAPSAAGWLVVWVGSPLTVWLLTHRSSSEHRKAAVPTSDLFFLRTVARRTWGYYSRFVSRETSWLPPDNYQVSHQEQVAMRTSPTNIGLWMLSALGARDFGYLTADQVVELLSQTTQTLGSMERYEGHLLNWYDIQTLKALEPRYVSTVDSGNLLGSLWSLEHGLDKLLGRSVVDSAAFAGLLDTAGLLKETDEGSGAASALTDSLAGDTAATSTAEAGTSVPSTAAAGTAASIRFLRQVRQLASDLAPRTEDSRYWREQFGLQASSWIETCERYLGWVEIADEQFNDEQASDELALLGVDAVNVLRDDLMRAPSLSELAAGDIACIHLLIEKRSQLGETESVLGPWIDRVLQAFHESQWLAGEMLAATRRLMADIRQLSESINMRFLYDPRCKLFRIGFNVTENRLDNAYYDLLATEARTGSYVAVARGEVPVEHWFSMARPHSVIGGRRVLLSWTGTMFEYLMPQLLLHTYKNSLLDQAAAEAVAVQIAYGRKRHVPWGISESAFADLDLNKTYQYKAFGIPGLGLKRGLEKELVVAPYACLLALSIAPRAVLKNLRRLGSLGMLDRYGYYDAIDFSRQASRGGERGVLVRSFMSHHQGMSFLSLNNFLHNNIVREHFHSDPRVRAFEPLLHESIPVGASRYLATRVREPVAESVVDNSGAVGRFDTPHTTMPKTQLLSNGRYSLMVTNSGGGYSQWGAFELTRWRADITRDSGGVLCYIHEPAADRLWSTSYHPTNGKFESYSAELALDRAVIRRVDNGIELKTEIVVSPEDDVEIRRITLVNRSLRARHLELTSYVELALAPHRADLQHPAFNKLFIQTEALPEHQGLLAYRRARREDEAPVFVGHRLICDGGAGGGATAADTDATGVTADGTAGVTADGTAAVALRFETDRAAFIGRGRNLENPLGAFTEPQGGQGYVLDPIFSLRTSVDLAAGAERQVTMVVAAGESRQAVVELLEKYGNEHAVSRAMGFAWAATQIELRALRIRPDEACRFQQIASHLLFPNARLRPSAQRIVENRKGQSGLWPYGISGDVPIVLLRIADVRDLGLVLQMLRAQLYWRQHGFTTDLVILNEEASRYDNPLRGQLEELVHTHATGAFLVIADQVPREDVVLLTVAARVVLIAARGALPQQLGLAAALPEHTMLGVKRRSAAENSAQLPFMELHYFNGVGGFTDGGREYVIYLGEGVHTPAPWVNVIANPSFGTLVGESGAGFSWYGNSQRNRLTEWSNDPVIDPSSELIYIRDEDSGAYWSPTASPIREATAYRARHGAGYTVFEHNSHGIEQELTVFVPMDEDGGEPVKLQRLHLKNATSRTRTLSVTYYLELTLGENRESSGMHVTTSWDAQSSALLARNRYHPEYGDLLAFASMTPSASSYTADRTLFLGRNGSLARPAAMARSSLLSRVGAGYDPCAALQTTVTLAAGASTDIVCVAGQTSSPEEADELVRVYQSLQSFEQSFARTCAWWDGMLGTIKVHTPEHASNFLINRWLLYQSLSCRMWGRSATYQSGGAFGFRDQLQDSMAFVYTRPQITREQILLAASRQFIEGDVQHWWHPPGGAGIRSRISDDLLWLPYVVSNYIRTTGDRSILSEQAPFLDAPQLEDTEHEIFSTPHFSNKHASVFEHCQRAVERSLRFGAHGLPLMGTGDWNDGMNLVGAEGRGESVWLGWFLVVVLEGMKELCDIHGDPKSGRAYEQQRTKMIHALEASAWDGEWYLRAFFDNGTPLGSAANNEGKIDSLPQSWARLSGAGDEARTRVAMESAWQNLVRADDALVLLFDPPFDTSEPSPGYIRGYPPGVRENGGQYTHAALWLAMAMARGGDGERAGAMLRMMNPIEQTRNLEAVWRYGVEPYVIAADVYRLPGRVGRGGWSWYTGSAAWMYRAWIEEVLGLQIRAEHMRLAPVIPAWWDSFEIAYRHGEAVYEVRVENPHHCERGVLQTEMNGRVVAGDVIRLERSAALHRVLVIMGDPATHRPLQ